MRKIIQKISAILTACLTFGMVACGPNADDSSSKDLWDGHGTVNVWTMPSTANPIQEEDCSQYYTNTPILEVSMAKNESEGAQILFHATKEVRSYTLETCDLLGENGDKIKKENISVYNTYYTHVERLSNPTSGRAFGHYPDALIPQELSEKVGENQVAADYNQSIFVDIFADKNLTTGVYTGDFTLKVDGETFTVPVSVRVRDFTLTDTNNVKSAYYLFSEYIMGGDLNNTPEHYKEYVDFLLDYRLCTTTPVYMEISDKEEWVRQMKEYAANPKVSSYNIGFVFDFETELRLLIENSTPELNLLEKAFHYLCDEPPASQLESYYGPMYYNRIDELIAISKSYTDEELATYGLTHADIEGIEVLITLTIGSVGTIEGLRTYCGSVEDYHTEAQRELYQYHQENTYLGANNELEGTDYGSTWWYTACYPYEPYPNYHIDNSVLDGRVFSWMQYDYDIDGMLYWGTACYFDTDTMNDDLGGWVAVDPYDDAEMVHGVRTQGDGFLLYPGAKYGESGPLPSLRLMNIRDGFEDYEYLLQLETLMNKYIDKYDLTSKVSFDDVMQSIYDNLYDGVIASADFSRVIDARKDVMDMIEYLDSDAHSILSLNSVDVLRNEITIDVYAEQGATLSVDGKNVVGAQSGEGVKFSYTQKLEGITNIFKAVLTFNGKSIQIEKELSSAVKIVNDCNTESNLTKWKEALRLGTNDYINLTYNTNADYVQSGTGSMRVQIDNGEWTDWEAANHLSYISLSKEDFFGTDNLSQVDYIEISLYNASDVEFRLDFYLQVGKNSKSFMNVTVKQGWNTIKVPYVNEMTWIIGDTDRLGGFTSVALGFELIDEDIDIYIDSIYYTYLK